MLLDVWCCAVVFLGWFGKAWVVLGFVLGHVFVGVILECVLLIFGGGFWGCLFGCFGG